MILRRCPTRLPLENLLAITYSFRFARRQFLLELPEELQLLWDGKVALLSLDIVAPDRQARLPLHVHARRGPLRALGLRSSEVVADLVQVAVRPFDHPRHWNNHFGLDLLDGAAERPEQCRDEQAFDEERQALSIHNVHHGEEGRGNARFEPVLMSMYQLLLLLSSINVFDRRDFSIDKRNTERLPNQIRPEEGSPRTRIRARTTNRQRTDDFSTKL